MDGVSSAENFFPTFSEPGIFEQLVMAFGLPEEIIRPWLEKKLNLYGLNKELLTLDQARELTAELVLEFFLTKESE